MYLDGSGTPVNGAVPLTETSFTVSNLTNGKQYSFAVDAVNEAGPGPKCAPVSATPQGNVPSAPTGLAAAPANARVVLSWNAVLGATGYNIYVGGSATPVNSTPVTGLAYTVASLANGTKYKFEVAALNSWGEGLRSNPVTATPNAWVTGLFALAGDGSVKLHWDALAGAEGYRIYVDGVGPVNKALVTSPSYTAVGLANGREYRFAVTALFGEYETKKSNEARATPRASAAPELSLADLYGPPYQLEEDLQVFNTPDTHDPGPILSRGTWVQPLEQELLLGWGRVFVGNMTYYIRVEDSLEIFGDRVYQVKITPKTATVEKGKTLQFAANVEAIRAATKDVNWRVNSTVSTIDSNGLLTVDVNEPLAQFTVTVTSVFDPTKTDTATVDVESNIIPKVAGLNAPLPSGTGTLTLSWDMLSNVEGYFVYVDGEKAADVSTNSYTVTGKAPGTLISVQVSAYAGDMEGEKSDELEVRVK